jgi:hypothetical protein
MTSKHHAGGGHTSWSASWEALLYARLHIPISVYESLGRLLKRYVTSNLLSIHPRLQNKHLAGCITCYTEQGGGRGGGGGNGLMYNRRQGDGGFGEALSRKREFETIDGAKVSSVASRRWCMLCVFRCCFL